jgi:glycosyltransferase involved in cell wall biosynthesis
LKILFVHSYYQQRGGEDSVFEQEFELLKQTESVEAVIFRNRNGWRGAFQFLVSVWNFKAAVKVRRSIVNFKPDIVQIYNWHYATGPIVIRTAKKMGIKVVLNLQNYRILCPSASLLHNGKIYTFSIDKKGFPWKAVRDRVYRKSFLQTYWLAWVVYLHKIIGTWHKVDQYIVPTNTVKKLFTEFNKNDFIKADKFKVKSNFSLQTGRLLIKRGNHFLFVGRLSEEKGIRVLLEAFENSMHELWIAGDGPLKQLVEESSKHFSNIKYVGNLDKVKVKEAMSNCSALIFSSIWYEPFGLVITEALSNGCPIISSNIGSPTELVIEAVTGIHFNVGDKLSLLNRLDYWQNLNEMERLQYGKNCIESYENLYTPDLNKKDLLSIYQTLLNR